MKNRWYCSVLLMLWLVVPHLANADFNVHNCTPIFLFVVQMRTKARTDDKKAYFDSETWRKDSLPVRVVAPLGFVKIFADTSSGYATYNRVLWVSNNLIELAKAISKDDRTGTQVQSIYLGGKQSGDKYIALVRGNKFVLAPSKEEALAKISKTIPGQELEAAVREKLRNDNSESEYYYNITPDQAAKKQPYFSGLNGEILKYLKQNIYP